MSKKITYTCNLCHTGYEDISKIMAWYYGILPNDSPKQGYYLTEKVDSSGTHICSNCIQALRKYLTPQPEQSK